MRKWTVKGTEHFEQKITADMHLIANKIDTILTPSEVLSVIVGGGYGRGEGGVKVVDGQEVPYNDYDLFIISRDLPRYKIKEIKTKVDNLGCLLSKQIGIEIEFSPIQPISVLPQAPFWLIWYELKYGHRVIWGKKNILNYLPNWKDEELPIIEAAKLLLNRGVGLYLAKQEIQKGVDNNSIEFIERNIYKAIQAMGDALLICSHQYHWSYLIRKERFIRLQSTQEPLGHILADAYEEAVEYKLRPEALNLTMDKYLKWYEEIVSLYEKVYYYVFSKLYNAIIKDVRTYLAHLENRFDTDIDLKEAARNFYLNFKDLKREGFEWDIYLRYPRYRLFYCFPWFFFGEKYLMHRIDKMLGTNESESDAIRKQKFLQLWQRYN